MATYNNIKKIKIGDNIFNLYDSGNSGGTITSVKTTAGTHSAINVTSGAANFNVPTKTSHLTNDSGFITSYTDTKNTAGSTDTSSKLFLVGATSQAANPQTYSHDTVYIGTDGCLYSNSTKVSVEGHTHSGYATSGHTHTLSLASSTGSSQLALAASTKYQLTAGGSTYIFTTPPNTTYSSKDAASGGMDVSLVTTGEKYTWNNKSNLTIGTTSTTAAAGDHTHEIGLGSTTDTASAVTLESATKYKLRAGGNVVYFTMPTIPTVSYPVTSVNSKTGAVSLTASDVGAATSGHTHTASLATSTGTSSITLASATKYSLTAGGSSVIFTMPTIPTVPSNIVNTITTTAGTHTAISSKTGSVSFNVPTKTSHLTNDSGFVTADENVKSVAGSTTTAAFYLTGSSNSSTETGTLVKHAEIYAAHNPNGAYISLGGGSSTYGGWLQLYSLSASYYATLKPANNIKANRTITLPDKDGTVALTSEIPSVPTNVSAFTNDAGYTTNTGTVTSVGLTNATNGGLTISGSPVTGSGSITVGHSNVLTNAQTTQAVYPIKIDKNGHISAYGNAQTILTIGTTASTAAAGNHTHSYAASSSAGGSATTAATTADTTNALYPVGVTSSAVTTLKRDTSITFTGGTISCSGLTVASVSHTITESQMTTLMSALSNI